MAKNVMFVVASIFCTCAADTNTGFAISGTHNSSTSGTYALTGHVCNGLPVYQKGGSGGLVLWGMQDWQHVGYKYNVGPSARATDCEFIEPIYLTSDGFCAVSPAGAGCANQWLEYPNGPDGKCQEKTCSINPAAKVVALPNPDLSVVAPTEFYYFPSPGPNCCTQIPAAWVNESKRSTPMKAFAPDSGARCFWQCDSGTTGDPNCPSADKQWIKGTCASVGKGHLQGSCNDKGDDCCTQWCNQGLNIV